MLTSRSEKQRVVSAAVACGLRSSLRWKLPLMAGAALASLASSANAAASLRGLGVACSGNSPGRFLVTSDGLTSEALQAEFRSMLGPDVAKKHMWYVPTAALAEGGSQSFVEAKAASLKKDYGLASVKVIDVAKVKGQALTQAVKSMPSLDVIYLEYGNTYYLRYHLRDSGGDELVRDSVRKDAIVVGASAGSIVLGRTVQTAFWKNWDDRTAGGTINVDWDNETVAAGLNLLGGRAVFPHANGPYAVRQWQDEQAQKYGHTDFEVIKLADGQGFVLDSFRPRMVG